MPLGMGLPISETGNGIGGCHGRSRHGSRIGIREIAWIGVDRRIKDRNAINHANLGIHAESWLSMAHGAIVQVVLRQPSLREDEVRKMYSKALIWACFADRIGDPDAPRLEVKVA